MRFPGDEDRHSIVGATGSGKTVSAVWNLSHRNFHTMPWMIYNFKADKNIDGIPHAAHIGVDEVPVRPGVYIVSPSPNDSESVEQQMWSIWQRGGIGVYVDEGYMIKKNNSAFRALLTQGRSRQIPMMILSQRPVWLDPFVFSESDYYQIFRLQRLKDTKHVEDFIPGNIRHRLPQYHSYYYDVGSNELVVLRPVPPMEEIYKTFDARLGKRKTVV